MDELKRFENDLKNNEELRRKLEEACKRIADEGQAQSDGELMVCAAKELGYDISIAALEQARAAAQELDPDELQHVAGGLDRTERCPENGFYLCYVIWGSTYEDEYCHDGWCLTAWHCAGITLHTETESQTVVCWRDYHCTFINNVDY